MSFLLHRQGVMAQPVLPDASAPVVFIDTFARADEPLDASGDWTLPRSGSAISVVNNRAQSTGTSNTGYARVARDFGQDMYAEIDVLADTDGADRWSSVFLRMAPDSSAGYSLRTTAAGRWNLGIRNATDATLSSLPSGTTAPPGSPYTARLEIRGEELVGFVNGVEVVRHTFTSNLRSGGNPGFAVQPATSDRPALTITRFEAGSL